MTQRIGNSLHTLLFKRISSVFLSPVRHYQVTILGAATDIGQTVGLLLRNQPGITKLVIHDYLKEIPGVTLDLSHIPSESSLTGYCSEHHIDAALKNADLVILTGGVILQPGMSKSMCYSLNTAFIKSVAARIARVQPMPFVGVVTEPINCTVPMTAEVMKNHGDFDGKKLFGITTVDLLRSQCLFASINKLNPNDCYIPVIGGHSDKTMIPLLSCAEPLIKLDQKTIHQFTTLIRKGDDIITKAKMGWSPTLSVAYSVFIFVRGILDALKGNQAQVNAFIENNDFGTSYFSGLVTVTKDGAADMQRFKTFSEYECSLLEQSINQLRKDISLGKKTLEYE